MAASTSAILTQVVNRGTTTTSVSSDRTPSSVFGTLVTFTASVAAVAPAVGVPTGTVQFFDNVTSLGAPVALVGGTATFSTGALSVGSHPINAVYSGDTNFSTSTGGMTQVVVQGTTMTVLTSDISPSLYGNPVTFTAAVSTVTGIGTPTGTVQFFDGGASLGSSSVVGGAATLTTSALGGGSHTISAVYSGDTNFSGSLSGAITQVVTPGTTSVVLTSDGPSVYGNPVVFTATVAVTSGIGTPTGTVEFFDGATSLGTANLVGGTTASFSTAVLGAGSHTIDAVFSGDANFTGNTASMTQVVAQGTTSTTVVSSANPSLEGVSVTFTATVAAVTGIGNRTGTVQFFDGAVSIGSGSVAGGTAILTIATLAFGDHSITAVYSGDANFTGSTSPPITQTVLRQSTTTVTSSRPTSSTFGQTVTFTATVRPVTGTGVPPGTVLFNIDGFDVGGARTLNTQGRATYSTNTLTAGSHLVRATYGGDIVTFFAGSTSATITQVVNKATSTTTLTSNINPSAIGTSVTITARVGPLTATGTVQFVIDNVPSAGGPVTLDPTGRASLTLNSLTLGAHTITANYSGNANHLTSTRTMTQTVRSLSSAVVATSGSPAAFGTNVTFTATVAAVAPGTGVPTGTVQFRLSGNNVGAAVPLNASGVATFTSSTIPRDTYTLTARYNGDANFWTVTSAGISQTIN